MPNPFPASTADVLRAFEATEANLKKLETTWERIRAKIPEGVCFGGDGEYDALCRTFSEIRAHLPAIDGWQLPDSTLDLDTIAQMRFDAQEIGEIEAYSVTESQIERPERDIAEYRDRFHRSRRRVIRVAVLDLVAEIDEQLQGIDEAWLEEQPSNSHVEDSLLSTLREKVAQINVLLGSSVERPRRWSDLQRHLYFGMRGDLYDIVEIDWPAVKPGLEAAVYGEDDPLPLPIEDLSQLSLQRQSGPVPTRLHWERLLPQDFERLIFALLSAENGYENAEWLMQTSAPDAGRDVSAFRVLTDPLSGTRRERVIAQCKALTNRSISAPDIATLKEQVRLWEPPRVDILIVATTGRFSRDAVLLIERHNQSDAALRIEMWPESHLEMLLAARPRLIAEFGLR